jgi:hypothetical protein
MMMNQSFRATRFVALAVLLTVTGAMSVFAQQPLPTPVATGKLKGVVVDWQYARIVRSCLTVRNKTFQAKVMVDEEGAFEAELPAGVYEVVALSPGFSRLRRKNVRIEPGAARTLNFLLEVAPEISGRCPANTIRRGNLCDSLCDTHPAPNNGMHPTADTKDVIYLQTRRAAGDAGR